MLNLLVHEASVMSQALVKGSESTKTASSVVTWNLLRGGVLPGALDENSHNPILEYLKEIKKEDGMAYKVCGDIRNLAPLPERQIPPLLKPKLTKELEKEWNYMINLSMLCLMYHSDIIEDAFEYSMGMDKSDPDRPKYEDKLKVVWRSTNNITRWFLSSYQGEKEIQILIRQSLQLAENMIEVKKQSILTKWQEDKEK